MTDSELKGVPSVSMDPHSALHAPTDSTADPDRCIDQILAEADRALTSLAESPGDSADDFPCAFSSSGAEFPSENVRRKTLTLDVEFGRVKIPLADVLSLRSGSVISLGRPSSPAVNLYCGGHLVAEGKIFIQNDRIAIRIAQKFPLVSPD